MQDLPRGFEGSDKKTNILQEGTCLCSCQSMSKLGCTITAWTQLKRKHCSFYFVGKCTVCVCFDYCCRLGHHDGNILPRRRKKKHTKKTEVTQRNITDCYTQTNYGVNRCLTHAKIVPQTCQNIVVLLLPHCRGDFKACPQKKKKKNWFCSHAKNMFPSSVPEVNMAETEVEKIPEKPHVLR